MLRIFKLAFSLLMHVVGIPGMLDDVEVWQRWFPTMTEWQWWNFLLVGCGTLLLIQTTYPWCREIVQKYRLVPNKRLASQKSQLLGSRESFMEMHGQLEEILKELKFSVKFLESHSPRLDLWVDLQKHRNRLKDEFNIKFPYLPDEVEDLRNGAILKHLLDFVVKVTDYSSRGRVEQAREFAAEFPEVPF